MAWWLWFVATGAAVWGIVLCAPWRPWSTREHLEAAAGSERGQAEDVTVLIPARNEEKTISAVLGSLRTQGAGLRVVLVDDQSTDGTAEAARRAGIDGLRIVAGKPLPPGWSGKLWALEQGLATVDTPLTLLLDADIVLAPGMLQALRDKVRTNDFGLVSLMAELNMTSWWERLLIPAFIFFFKLLYPFRLANGPWRRIAAAAGGCILVRTQHLRDIGAFASLRDALIDDCTLAARIKRSGVRTWIGLTHGARSNRRHSFASIWNMVARTAFTQLGYSTAALLSCSAALLVAFAAPVAGLFVGGPPEKLLGAAALAAMAASYVPTLRFYNQSPWFAAALPLTGLLYLCMTWSSAIGCWRGKRSQWKGRVYASKNRSS